MHTEIKLFKAMFTRCAQYYYQLGKHAWYASPSSPDQIALRPARSNRPDYCTWSFTTIKWVYHWQLLLMQPPQNIVTLTAFHISSNENAIPLTVIHIRCIGVDRPATRLPASFSVSQVAVWVEAKTDLSDNTFTVNNIRHPWRIHV